jgi:hypothetical protein
MDQIHICRDFGDKDWEVLRKRLGLGVQTNERDWQHAIDVFHRRMQERFFLCIKALEEDVKTKRVTPLNGADADRALSQGIVITTGFAIMALCCLLIDTLQFFRAGKPPRAQPQGCPRPEKCAGTFPGTGRAFVAFLTECLSFGKDEAKDFTDGVRNGIFHQAETRGWVVKLDEPEGAVLKCEMIRLDGVGSKEVKVYTLNRTVFCTQLRDWYEGYIKRLRDPKEEASLREHFAAGMDHVVEFCRKIR